MLNSLLDWFAQFCFRLIDMKISEAFEIKNLAQSRGRPHESREDRILVCTLDINLLAMASNLLICVPCSFLITFLLYSPCLYVTKTSLDG